MRDNPANWRSEMSAGLELRYFVLKPKGRDEYARASRTAMRAYADSIESVNEQLAQDLREWARLEDKFAMVVERRG
jgi:hypothetical protein